MSGTHFCAPGWQMRGCEMPVPELHQVVSHPICGCAVRVVGVTLDYDGPVAVILTVEAEKLARAGADV